jgi:pimeloyl-[acyl-carrier protein] methyl ester esterase
MSKPRLVLLHGWAMHGGVFAPLSERLGARFDLHLLDLPGHGRRRREAVPETLAGWAEALLAEAPAEAVWLGWSLGGLVALEVARIAPERCRGLVLLASSPRLEQGEDWPGLDPALLSAFAEGLVRDRAGTIERFLALEALGSGQPVQDLRRLRLLLEEGGEPSAEALAVGLKLLQETDLRPALPALAVPSLWIAGANDRIVPAQAVEAGARLARGGFERIARAGHAPFLTRPALVAERIAAFAEAA